ncbi:ATP-binding protein [Clostridium pasteurianum]|uniref:ATP-binding protein n=1 Tax=Clostridium pasteurianum TaxID=1501 RepID=UPI0003AA3787|nr:ATP-binding protein [Clostridium pasteurianum]
MPEESIETIKGKEIWIERCIANLIDNAIKFLDENKTSNEISIQVLEDNKNVIKIFKGSTSNTAKVTGIF